MSTIAAFQGTMPANYEKYLGPILFEPYATDLRKRLSKINTGKILEIACGTGRVTKHLLSLISDNDILTATDLSDDMISVAKEKVIDKRIRWEVADAQDLPYEDGSFDTVVCQYGVMFFPDKPKAFSEIYRVLEKGGLFIFNTWDKMETNPSIAIVNNVVQEEFISDPPDFLEKGPFSFSDKMEIDRLISEAGYNDIVIETVKVKSSYRSAEDMVKGFINGSPLAAYLSEKGQEKTERIKERTKDILIKNFGEHSDNIMLQAIVCEARK